MNQHEPSTQLYPLAQLAAAWRQHAERDGVTDPATELTSMPAGATPHSGYWPAFYVPTTGETVIVKNAQPYPTPAAARDFLRWMLEQLHANGNVTLYRLEELTA